MSRIGKSPITIPEGVTVDIKDGIVTVKGKLGELTQDIQRYRCEDRRWSNYLGATFR